VANPNNIGIQWNWGGAPAGVSSQGQEDDGLDWQPVGGGTVADDGLDWQPVASASDDGLDWQPVASDDADGTAGGGVFGSIMNKVGALGRGVKSGLYSAAGSTNLIAGMPIAAAIDKVRGDNDATNWWANTMIDPAYAAADRAAPQEGADVVERGAFTLGRLVPDMAMMYATRGASAEASALGRVAAETTPQIVQRATGEALMDSARASVLPATMYGAQTARDVVQAGGSSDQALTAGATEAAMTAVTNALPLNAAGGWLSRAGQGAASNVVADVTQNAVVNQTLPPELQRELADPTQLGLSALIGAPMGAAFGSRPQPANAPRGVLNDVLDGNRPTAGMPTTLSASQVLERAGARLAELDGKAKLSAFDVEERDLLRQAGRDPSSLAEVLGVDIAEPQLGLRAILALPPPTREPIQVDRAGVAVTPEQRAALAQRDTDLGMTPDIVRTQATRWADQAQQTGAAATVTPPRQMPMPAGARRFEQMLSGIALDARDAQQQRQKERQMDAIARESRLPAELFDASQDARLRDASGEADVAAAPTAMQLAMAQARQQQATRVHPMAEAGSIVDPATGQTVAPTRSNATASAAPSQPRSAFADPDTEPQRAFAETMRGFGVPEVAIQKHLPKISRDDVTGFFDARAGGIKAETVKRAQDHVRRTGEPAVYVSADVFNLGGLNAHFGDRAEDANPHYRAMANILSEELRAAGADVVPMRTGGDETGAVAVNITPEAAQAAVARAESRISTYAQEQGLAGIAHPKRKGESGVGMHIGLTEIEPNRSIKEIFDDADDGVNQSKRRYSDVIRSQAAAVGALSPEGQPGRTGPGDGRAARGVRAEGGRGQGGTPGAIPAAAPAPAAAQPVIQSAPRAPGVPTPAPETSIPSRSLLTNAKRVDDGIHISGDPKAIRAELKAEGIKGIIMPRGDGIILQGKPLRDFENWRNQRSNSRPTGSADAATPARLPSRDRYDQQEAFDYVQNNGEFQFGDESSASRYAERLEAGEGGRWAAQEEAPGRWRAVRQGYAEASDTRGLSLDEAQFSRASGTDDFQGISVDAAQRVVDDFRSAYRGNIPVEFRVVNTLEDAYGPGATERAGRASGAFHPRSRILVLAAANLRDAPEAARTIRHEILGHYGLNTLDPADKRAVLESILSHRTRATSFALRGLWKDIDARYDDKPELVRAEEVFALAAEREQGALGKAWDEIVSAVIRGLRKIGLVRGAISLAEIRQLVRRIGDGIRNGTAKQQTFPESDQTQFRRTDTEHLSGAQVSAMQKIGAARPPEPFKATVARIKDRAGLKLAQGLVDQFAPLRDLDMTAYMQARLSKGTDGALEAVFLHGKPSLVDGALKVEKDGTDGLRGILSDLSGEHEQFLAWIAGNRADALSKEWTVDHGGGNVERYKTEAEARDAAKQWPLAKVEPASRERLFTPAEIAALKSLNQGVMANGRSRHVAFAKAHREFRAYQKAVLDIAEQAGLIDGDSRATWESDFYVPFYRVLEDEKAGTFKPAGGASLVRQQAFRELRGGKGELQDLLNNVLQNWSHLLAGSMRNIAGTRALDAAVTAGIAERIGSAEKGSVWIQKNGRQVHYRVDDALVLDALVALDYSGIRGGAMDVMRKFKHALTVGVTISPTFRIRNLMRDTISAIGTSDDAGWNPLRNLVEGWKDTKHGSDTDVALLSGGGKVRFGTMLDGEAKTAKRLIKMGVKDADILTTPEKVKNAMRSAWDWWDRVGDRSETVNRAAIYENAIKAGKSHLEASYEARDLMDFTMSGKWAAMRFLTGAVPFLNARAQGLYKLGRAAKGNPTRFTAVTGAVAMASALAYLLQKDDDDYKALPDWARDTYWCVKLGGTMVYIPKPFEIGALGTVVERGTELMLGGDDYRAGDFASSIAGLLMNTLSMNPMPQAAKPLVEAIYNTDSFRDQSIDSMGDENLPARDRYDASTSAGAIAVARAMDAVVGDRDLGSPKRIEHMVRGYLGWLGAQALNVSDLLLRDAMDLSSNPKRDLTKIDNVLVLGDLMKDAEGGSSKYIQRFYDMQREIDQTYRAMRNARATGDDARADELAEDPMLEKRSIYQGANRRMQRINDQIKIVRNDRTLSAQEKRIELDALYAERNAVAKETDEAGRADWQGGQE
jgi:hypothetical protein